MIVRLLITKLIKRQLFFVLVVLLGIQHISCSSKKDRKYQEAAIKGKSAFFLVKKVVDGDTFWLDDGSPKGLKIRLIGIDAPESRKTFNKEVGYFGKEAKQYMNSLIARKKVRLEYDVENLDQFGRTLAYVYLEDGTFVNAELVKNGYALVMTVPPNVKFANEFVRLQQEARENKRGLWNEGN